MFTVAGPEQRLFSVSSTQDTMEVGGASVVSLSPSLRPCRCYDAGHYYLLLFHFICYPVRPPSLHVLTVNLFLFVPNAPAYPDTSLSYLLSPYPSLPSHFLPQCPVHSSLILPPIAHTPAYLPHPSPIPKPTQTHPYPTSSSLLPTLSSHSLSPIPRPTQTFHTPTHLLFPIPKPTSPSSPHAQAYPNPSSIPRPPLPRPPGHASLSGDWRSRW